MKHGKPNLESPEQSESTAGFTLPSINQKQLGKTIDEIKPGTKIGEFIVNEKMGSGGLGDVYKAALDGTPKKFAIKIIRPDIANDALIERFNQERTMLGTLDHANIVSITYTGNYHGLPFFAMEYVDGLPITKYADKQNLTIKERLILFQQVCEAVASAHEKEVIHRDLKPANILVTEKPNGEPMVKVIDFGIAKVLNDGPSLAYATQTGLPIGTLAYMSPEQTGKVSEKVSKSTDIYSLGVILYELLVGELPLRIKGAQKEQIETICDMVPMPPSARISEKSAATYFSTARKRGVDQSQLKQLLKGELDEIVMKCLEKNPENRFETVSSLGTTIQNYLNNKPTTNNSISITDSEDGGKTLPSSGNDESVILNENNFLVSTRRIVVNGNAFRVDDVRSVEIIVNKGTVKTASWLHKTGKLIASAGLLFTLYYGSSNKLSIMVELFYGLIYCAPGALIMYFSEIMMQGKASLIINTKSGVYTLMSSSLQGLKEDTDEYNRVLDKIKCLSSAISKAIATR